MKIVSKNNTDITYKNTKGTPRAAICLYFSTETMPEHIGAHVLMGNLLLQGTKDKTAEQIATELENLGINLTVTTGTDYSKISIVCLNEDVERALDITADIVENVDFKTFDKEVFKYKGETIASLDSPVAKAADALNRRLFQGHKYSNTSTKILECIDELKFENVVNYFKETIYNSKKVITIAADMEDEEAFIDLVSKKLPFMQNSKEGTGKIFELSYTGHDIIKTVKNDAKQAQIFEGWVVPGAFSKDCAKFCTLSTILGASGLSSRLFSELRDKQGLAYTVRSSYKTFKEAASFTLYIGTEPSNIQKCLKGFRSEIERLITEPPTKEELRGAKENYIGKYKYCSTQTNLQIAGTIGWNEIVGLGAEYDKKLLSEIEKVTSEDIVEIAKKYLLEEPVISILAPEKYLNF